MNPLVRGLSRLYGRGAELKNAIYDRGLRKPMKCGKPVISVGNITMGGTGKTPIVDLCVRLLLEHGHRPGIVARSYRARARGPARVNPEQPGHFGDEACWYARRYPQIPVYSGPVKAETAWELAQHEDVDVVLVDDGFQHRALARDVDLVLLDATDPMEAYEPIPAGRAREGFEGVRRASAVILTKVNLSSPEHVQALRRRIGEGPRIFEFSSVLKAQDVGPGPFLAVSGIARPESFEALLRERYPSEKIESLAFRDHHPYKAEDVARIVAAARTMGATKVLVTEKDEVKLRPLWSTDLPFVALSLEVSPRESVESFYGFLDGAFH